MTRSIPSVNKLFSVTRRYTVEISTAGCVFGALGLLILPLKLLGSAFLAAAVHEFCHIITLQFCQAKILHIRIGFEGAVIQTQPLPPFQELLCAAAGPIGNFLSFLLVRRFPVFGLCALLQGLYNMLPIYPMDGGRILYCICLILIPKWAESVKQAVSKIVGISIICTCVWLFCRSRQSLLLLFGAYFLHRCVLSGKTPCKEVQY